MSGPLIVQRDGRVLTLRLNRPDALNALSVEVMNLLGDILEEAERDPSYGAVLLLGSERAFCAGADIIESQNKSYPEVYLEDWQGRWERIAKCRLPMVAAVSGYALGGGCELAMLCDVLLASETARFGLPEVKLGVIPGMGGTQRMIRAVGKAKASELILTGRMMDADEAERAGLVARVLPSDQLEAEARRTAAQIAGFGRAATLTAKETLGRAYESSLAEGLLFERRAFHALFATKDQKEGMAAFAEKRAPRFHAAGEDDHEA